MALWTHQLKLIDDIYRAWTSNRNVLAVSPTGSGKTVIFSSIIQHYPGASCAIAHRQELVSQMSLTLARNKVRHRIIGAATLPRLCTQIHMMELGESYYDPSAMCAVAGVDTLVRMDARDPFFSQVGLCVQDEAHHMLRANKWGKASEFFPNAHWLGVTATATRADGRGLGRQSDGIFDVIVEGPNMRQLINSGYLTDYRIFAPPSDLDLSQVPTAASGDYSPEPLRKAVHGSHIVGDVVDHYKRLASGKLGVTFAVDVESAQEIASAYRKADIPAEVVSAKTPDATRIAILRKFASRQIMQLVNVDLFGEGFDLPAIECVSFARPTQSYGLFVQQFGRALRLMIDPVLMEGWNTYSDQQRLGFIGASSKRHAIIIDHVSNVHRHGLPDSKRDWNLDRRERRSRNAVQTVFPIRTCLSCFAAYEAYQVACPYCGFRPEPAGRATPDQVDGDLLELSPETLAKLRGEIYPPLRIPYEATPEIAVAITRRYYERMEEQGRLILTMQQWGGVWTFGRGHSISEAQRMFYFRFGVDVASAQALPRAEAESLRERIERDMT